MNFPTRKSVLFTCLHVLVLLLILFTFPVMGTIQVQCLEKERSTLLKIKAESEWRTKEYMTKDCCKWNGVHCDNKTNHVVALDFSTYSTNNKISPFLRDLVDLKYLTLDGIDFNGSPIPEFMASLGKLRHLSIRYSNIGGVIPRHLGNLSMLRYLDLSGNSLLNITDLDWLSHLRSLKYLDLSFVNLSRATTWMQVIINLPSLNHLELHSCSLSSTLPPSLPLINTSTSLSYIDLSHNSLSTDSVLVQFLSASHSFRYVDFSNNYMTGRIPDALGNLKFLSHVDLSRNRLEGGVPTALWNSTMLDYLDLGENRLHGSFPEVLKLPNLESLGIYGNGFVGNVPDLTWCTSLQILDFHDNMLNGTLTKSIGSLSKLQILQLGSNHLEGIVDEDHFYNLSELRVLNLSFNSNLRIKIDPRWNPPFELGYILLSYCNLGPKFPQWLIKASSWSSFVDISNAGISDTIDQNMWNNSICFWYLNISYNHISGIPPDLSCNTFQYVDLSSNEFNGSLPLLSQNLNYLNIAGNKLFGALMNICDASNLRVLDLSDNQLSGHLPECLMNLTYLEYLNLENNFFYGEIPKSLGYLNALSSLHLRNNNFQGKFPIALRQCRWLHVLDLGENNFSGNVPIWVGTSLSNLAVLSLTSNDFYGGLPSTLCHLQNLQTLDISLNKISGTVPKCIGNFSSMTWKPGAPPNQSQHTFSFGTFELITFYDKIQIIWKDHEVEYKRNLILLKAIDFSSNKLIGQIPPEVTSLNGLFALNISRNNLSGSIPPNIGQMELLNSLDLSQNHLSGRIPDTLSQLSHLGVLNLSFNDLSGRIPWNTHMQTFNSLSYAGNFELCGPPLSKTCPEDDRTHENSNSTDNDRRMDDGELITTGFYISMTLGFIFGFWGIFGTLILNKSCRFIWFKMLTDVNNWFCVNIAVNRNRMRIYFQTYL